MYELVDRLEERKPAALTSNDQRIKHLLCSETLSVLIKSCELMWQTSPSRGYNKCDKDTLDVLQFFFPSFCLRLSSPIIINV